MNNIITENIDLLKELEERFDSLESNLNGSISSRHHEVRKEAFKQFLIQGFPGKKNEEYKYTPIARVLEKDFSETGQRQEVQHSDLLELLLQQDDVQILVFEDGHFNSERSSFNDQEGMKLMSLSEASKENDDTFLKFFNKAIPSDNDSFSLLNTSFSEEGVFLHISKNKAIKKPILVLHVNKGDKNIQFANPRNLLVFEEGCEATFIECFQTSGSSSIFSNSFTEFIVKQNAKAKYFRFGFDSENSIRVSTANIYQENNSSFTSLGVDFGGKTIRNNLNIMVDGTGCESNMNGLYLLKGDSHVDNHTIVDHKQPHCESNELYKGILAENARGVFNGKIYVRKEAQKTNAFQQNNNILLSDNAVIDTKPQLEIWADDVKCSHGCTSGQLDDEQIFYLRTRGIDVNSAKKILLHAYAAEILESLHLDVLREFTEERIGTMLEEI